MQLIPSTSFLARVGLSFEEQTVLPFESVCLVSVLAFLVLAPLVAGLFWLCYYLFSLPLRRVERARFFLDLIESGFRRGQSAEHTIVAISSTEDATVGVRFHWLASALAGGCSLAQGLERIPGMLPRQIMAMLKAGDRLGDLAKVLPACRVVLRDGRSQLTKAHNYLMVLAFLVTPLGIAALPMLSIYVFPKYAAIMTDLGIPPPWLMETLMRWTPWLVAVHVGFFLFLLLGGISYAAGPSVWAWLETGLPHFSERLNLWLPWKQKRLQRDFSSVLATLLDGGMPEAQAVLTAAECTANGAFVNGANRAVEQLSQGAALDEALRQFDPSHELSWRLSNAARSKTGFAAALSGWQEALDARAFQQEQATAQLFTTGLVLFNGLFVGLIAIAVFQPFLNLVNEGLLW